MYIEWAEAQYVEIEWLKPGEISGDGQTIDDDKYGLCLGVAGGGALCLEGTISDLKAVAERINNAIREDDRQTCDGCEGSVYALSSRGLCDDCEEELDTRVGNHERSNHVR